MLGFSLQAQSRTGYKELGKDQVHHLLSNSRRRHVLKGLLENGPLSKRELVDKVAEREYALPIERVGYDERKRVLVSLSQCHLPKLQDSAVIAENQGTFDVDRNVEPLKPHLDFERSIRDYF